MLMHLYVSLLHIFSFILHLILHCKRYTKLESVAVWDKKMVHTQYKWSWYHVPTFAPYKVECVFYPLILASGGHAQTTKTALVVLQSLTPNAQSVFRVLAEYQLANEKEEGE
jgi:hypothetical protein